jgi:hypothetical protein
VQTIRCEILPKVRAGLTEGEVRALELYLAGRKRTAEYAEALGITDWTPAERKAEVHRVKNKLTARIERARRKHDAPP